MLLQSTIGMVSAEGRAVAIDVSVEKFDWLSNETVAISIELTNAPYNEDLEGKWVLFDENNAILLNGSHIFQASGTVTTFEIPLKHFYNGDHFYSLEIDIIDSSNAVLNSDGQSFTVFENAQFPTIGNLIAFGDSLSDMGNGRNSILNVPDVPPYWQGRFSNGQVWIEYLSEAYSVTTTIGSGTSAGDNRAFGGSQTGPGYSYVLLPNVGTQISNYLSNVQSSIPSDTVVSLWSGGNDFLYGTANANTIVTNMESHIRQLEGVGADEIILPNLPPLEKTPEVLSRSQNQQNAIGSEVILYNQKLATLANDLRIELGITIHFIDAWTVFNDILQNKEALGLTNTQDAACSGGISILPLPICSSGDSVVSNVDEYLFFDKAHPTRVMHRFIGKYATEEIGQPDTDGDGVINLYDTCEWTNDGASTNLTGCSWEQQDDDDDGVLNLIDMCPNTELGAVVDSLGCSAEQRDSDSDGFNDAIDPCPFSQSLLDHDNDGCSNAEDLDDDNDGIEDVVDQCPLGMIGIHSFDLDEDGCHDDEDADLDGDGLSNNEEEIIGTDERDYDTDDDFVGDGDDAFPLDRSEWADSDGDGCGDNSDMFPHDALDCSDVDEDGVGDNTDAFPIDSTEWSDSDSDGYGDNSDQCPLIEGYALVPLGCLDSDGDGFGDSVDAFPFDENEWSDSDNDSVGDFSDLFPNDPLDWADRDNDSYGDNRDVFPFDPSEWNDTDGDGVGDNSDVFPNNASEWFDTDGDGCGDNIDVWPNNSLECYDQDYDGVGDNSDAFPLSAYEWLDSDGDGMGDNSDLFPFDKEAQYDSDGDGIANAHDPFPGNPNMDSWLDLILRLMILNGFIGVGYVLFQKRKLANTEEKWDTFEEQTQHFMEAEEIDSQRPASAPSPDAFTFKE
ncbi:MAG: hypothetical protein HOJ60_06605 [Euryarchaeota archaeon]|nr:hypothetical protein [Euryarchaeota archaeon]